MREWSLEQKNTAELLKEPFDPIFELEKIKQLPREERRRAIDVYKEKLMSQKEELADAEEALLAKFRQNPDKPKEYFLDLVSQQVVDSSFSEAQRALIFDTASEMVERRIFIKDFRKSFPKNLLIFKELFKFIPSGDIKVELGPLDLVVKIYNLSDFARISEGGFLEHRKATKEEQEKCIDTGGKTLSACFVEGLNHSVVIMNMSEELKEMLEDSGIKWSYRDALDHEEQHALNWFLTEKKVAKYLGSYPFSVEQVKELDSEVIEPILCFIRKYEAERDFKNEVLAFINGGANLDQIEEMLIDQEGSYSSRHYTIIAKEVIRKSLKPGLSEKNTAEFDALAERVLGVELLQIQKRALKALRELSESGVPLRRMVSLLQGEALTSWPNFARRYSMRLKEKNSSGVIS